MRQEVAKLEVLKLESELKSASKKRSRATRSSASGSVYGEPITDDAVAHNLVETTLAIAENPLSWMNKDNPLHVLGSTLGPQSVLSAQALDLHTLRHGLADVGPNTQALDRRARGTTDVVLSTQALEQIQRRVTDVAQIVPTKLRHQQGSTNLVSSVQTLEQDLRTYEFLGILEQGGCAATSWRKA